MSNKSLEELQIEHFKRTVAESDREKAKEKRRLEVTVEKLKNLISLTSSLDYKIKTIFLYLGLGLAVLGIVGLLSSLMIKEITLILAIVAAICFVVGSIFVFLFFKQEASKRNKLVATAKEATNIGKQVINTLTAYQFTDEENMQGTIGNIEAHFTISPKRNMKQLRAMGNSILNELIILNQQAKTMLGRVNDDLVEI
ncbi:PMP-22/EMP/MP20 family protein [Mycoplasmopsis gallinarum]|uniref:hypothetical protein n=1 Tax=Mycoplasmopsis gallinarum TaxID=29557 RepID=UPI0004880270|nr:hypothetical protein [Mycoplasmopsis gallinarum]